MAGSVSGGIHPHSYPKSFLDFTAATVREQALIGSAFVPGLRELPFSISATVGFSTLWRRPCLLSRVAGNGYKARAGEPFGLTAEGPTPDEALRLLRQEVDQKVAAGATLTSLGVPSSEHPWLRWAGTLKDDPLVDEWRQAVAEYCAEIDNDPNIP